MSLSTRQWKEAISKARNNLSAGGGGWGSTCEIHLGNAILDGLQDQFEDIENDNRITEVSELKQCQDLHYPVDSK